MSLVGVHRKLLRDRATLEACATTRDSPQALVPMVPVQPPTRRNESHGKSRRLGMGAGHCI